MREEVKENLVRLIVGEGDVCEDCAGLSLDTLFKKGLIREKRANDLCVELAEARRKALEENIKTLMGTMDKRDQRIREMEEEIARLRGEHKQIDGLREAYERNMQELADAQDMICKLGAELKDTRKKYYDAVGEPVAAE